MKAYNVTFLVLAVVLAMASLAAAQTFGDYFQGFSAAQSSGGRSNTGNAGPIQFPNSPVGSETSGVVVGASGFGFVPPGGRTGGARGVYPNLNSIVPGLGPALRPSFGPSLGPSLGASLPGGLGGGLEAGLRPSLASSSFRLGPLRSPISRPRPSVSYSTSHVSLPGAGLPGGGLPGVAPSTSVTHPNSLGPLLWRLPGRSPSFLSGNTASFSSGSFGSEDYL